MSFLFHTVSVGRKSGSGLAEGCGSDSGSLMSSPSSHLPGLLSSEDWVAGHGKVGQLPDSQIHRKQAMSWAPDVRDRAPASLPSLMDSALSNHE